MNVCEEVITSSWTSTVDWLMLAQPSWRRGVWLEAFIAKGKGPEDKCWCLPRRSKLFFSLKEFFSPKTELNVNKIHKNVFDLICAVWRISIIRLKYKDNNNRKQRNCGRRRWRRQEVASYLRRQPILWQILSVRATNRRPSCLKIKPMTTTSTLCLHTDFTEWGEIPDGWNNLNVCNEGNIFLWPVFQVFHVASFPHHCSWTCSIWRLLMVYPVPLQPKPAKMGLVGFCWTTERRKILEGVRKRFPADVLQVGSKTSSFFQ